MLVLSMCTRTSSAARDSCSLAYTIGTPTGFHRPPYILAPSPSNATAALSAGTIRQPVMNKHRAQFDLTGFQPPAHLLPSSHNPAVQRHPIQTAVHSATGAHPLRFRTNSLLCPSAGQSASPDRIPPTPVAPAVSSAEWSRSTCPLLKQAYPSADLSWRAMLPVHSQANQHRSLRSTYLHRLRHRWRCRREFANPPTPRIPEPSWK